MTRRALASIGSGPMAPVIELAAQTFQRYATRHAYDLVLGDGESFGRPLSWGKIPLLRRLLDEYDEVLWIDSDAIILDDSVDLSSQVPAGAYQAMGLTKLPQGGRLLNSGVWLLRGDRAKEFLDRVWELDRWTNHGWWEQRAVIELLGFDETGSTIASSPWIEGTHWLADEWNVLEWIEGLIPCRIRHYSYRSNDFRCERMAIDLARLNGSRTAWLKDRWWRHQHPESPRQPNLLTPVRTFFRKVPKKLRYEYSKRWGRLHDLAVIAAQRAERARQVDVTYGPGSAELLEKVQPFTMTSEARIFALRDAVRDIVQHNTPGAFVECGVWRGGSAMVMMLTLRQLGAEREIVLFDTFNGMTAPTDVDVDLNGVRAADLLADDSPERDHYRSCASLDEVTANLAQIDYPSHLVRFVEGPVEATLPDAAPDTIALLRLDTDWYESTRHELVHLYPRVSTGGVIIIDDYGHFLGARKATDEYWSTIAAPPLLTDIDYTGRLAIKRE